MSKVITDKEMAQIIHRAVNEVGFIECSDAYEHFLEDLSELIAYHFGAMRSIVSPPDNTDNPEDLGWTVCFHVNDCTPSDGGIFKDYDTDITWKDGKEL